MLKTTGLDAPGQGPERCCVRVQKLTVLAGKTGHIPMFPNIWVANRTRVAKGQQLGCVEAIQTQVVYFQGYHCLSVCSVGT